MTRDGDFLIFEGNRYSRKGFLYKNFTLSAVIIDGVKPTLAELERFEEQPEGIDLELPAEKEDKAVLHSFSAGDNVEVFEGELINLQVKICFPYSTNPGGHVKNFLLANFELSCLCKVVSSLIPGEVIVCVNSCRVIRGSRVQVVSGTVLLHE